MAPNETMRPQWGHVEYVWKLENFWELRALASIEALDEDNGDVVWSSRFGDEDHGIWRLKLYPYGDSSSSGKGHVSLFLSLDVKKMANPRAYSIFGCYVLDEKGDKMPDYGRSFTRQRFADQSCSWGWSQFIKVEGQSLSKILVGDALTLKCQIDVFLGMTSNSHIEVPLSLSLSDDLMNFAGDPEQTDVRVTWQPSDSGDCHNPLAIQLSYSAQGVLPPSVVVFEANSFVLAARSPKFRQLLAEQTGAHSPLPSSALQPAMGHNLQPPFQQSALTTNTQYSAYTSFGAGTADVELSGGRLSSLPSVTRAPAHVSPPGAQQTTIGISGVRSSVTSLPVVLNSNVVITPNSADNERKKCDILPRYVIRLEGITLEAATELFNYIKTDKSPLLEELSPKVSLLLELAEAAERYQVASLLWKVVRVLLGRITNEQDCVAILEKGVALKIEPLINEGQRFLRTSAVPLEKRELLSYSALATKS